MCNCVLYRFTLNFDFELGNEKRMIRIPGPDRPPPTCHPGRWDGGYSLPVRLTSTSAELDFIAFYRFV